MSSIRNYYTSARLSALRKRAEILRSQIDGADAEAQVMVGVFNDLIAQMRENTAPSIPAALELPFVREDRDRALGKAEKLRRELEEVNLRLQNCLALQRGGES